MGPAGIAGMFRDGVLKFNPGNPTPPDRTADAGRAAAARDESGLTTRGAGSTEPIISAGRRRRRNCLKRHVFTAGHSLQAISKVPGA